MSLNRDILFIGIDGGDRNFASVTVTGNIFLAPGTATNPSLAFAADRNTGIFNPSQDVFGIAAGGVDSVWFSATAWQGLSTLTGGIQLYNTPDTTTNYERLSLAWSANAAYISSGFAGLGTGRSLVLGTASTGSLLPSRMLTFATAVPFFTFDYGSTSSTTSNGFFVLTGTSTATSGSKVQFAITPTYNQASGNAANTDLKLARTETALGSGIQNFIQCLAGAAGTTEKFTVLNTGIMSFYAGVATAGWGSPAIYGNGTIAATTNARSATVATYTVGAADGTFVISGNVNVTTSTTHSFSLDCVYTDETNASRTLVIPMAQLAGTFVASGLITNITGAGPYESASMTIRCKASTSITIRPSAGGTYTTVVYNVNASIAQIA